MKRYFLISLPFVVFVAFNWILSVVSGPSASCCGGGVVMASNVILGIPASQWLIAESAILVFLGLIVLIKSHYPRPALVAAGVHLTMILVYLGLLGIAVSSTGSAIGYDIDFAARQYMGAIELSVVIYVVGALVYLLYYGWHKKRRKR